MLRKDLDRAITNPEEKTPFENLYESVFNGNNAETIRRFIAIKHKRNATIPDWMLKRAEGKSK